MKKISCFFFALLIFSGVSAQKKYTIHVTDQNSGKSINKATLLNTSTNVSVTTDESGAIVNGDPGQSVSISCIGYKTVKIELKDQFDLNITLEAETTDLDQIVMIGSRSGGRGKTETAVPVDVIKVNQTGMPTGRMDLTSVLNFAAPSFNYNKQTGSDGADHIELGTLRGLGPDQTLVLINGKRRHQTAFVALFGTRGRGNSGSDLNAFPQVAVDRLEILRDGASAQYGSDAMAGVINIILKKNINQWEINTGWAGHYDDKYNAYQTRSTNQYYYSRPIDGGTFNFSANHGVKLNDHGGFVNFSLSYMTAGKTFRQVADTNVWTNKNALPLNGSRRAFGDGSLSNIGGFFNMELPGASKKTTFYAFGGYNNKSSDAYAYTRNYSWNPARFPIDANGNLVFDDQIMRIANDGEIYYNPRIQTKINDLSLATGIRGKMKRDWNWDLSNTIGRNDFHYYGHKTYNASMIITPGTVRQTHFDDGGFNFLQNTLNLDFNKNFSGSFGNLNLALGSEFRFERYQIYAGEEASYKTYQNSTDQAGGAQGFPGFSPGDEVKANRTNVSFYADAEYKVNAALLLDGAVRVENYSDFGSVATYKLATRYKINNKLNFRGSASTGFRAPSLQQINFSNTLTSFYGGVLVNSRIVSNNDPIARIAGIDKLKQETSTNFSAGFAWKPISGMTVTIDGYMVKVKDRIVLSGLFSAGDTVNSPNDPALPVALTNQMNALDVATTQFFANSVNTTNYGVDVLIDYTKKIGKNTLKALLAGNIQSMKVDQINIPEALNNSYRHRKTFFSDREEAFLKASAPNTKWNLTMEYAMRKVSVGARMNYFGKMKTLGFGWTGLASAAGTAGPGDPNISGSFTGIDPYVDIDGYSDGVNVAKEEFIYNGKATLDLFVTYKINKKITLFAGADNVLNVHPNFAAVMNARYQAFDNEAGGAWEPVQMGFNGRRLFARVAFNF